jgi:hypothetical protein
VDASLQRVNVNNTHPSNGFLSLISSLVPCRKRIHERAARLAGVVPCVEGFNACQDAFPALVVLVVFGSTIAVK